MWGSHTDDVYSTIGLTILLHLTPLGAVTQISVQESIDLVSFTYNNSLYMIILSKLTIVNGDP